ncbi:MAG: epoxyqueuosine reductase [Deltaproteobacteria bacterium]|nr:epoxyqueuosine reductase [Deltaproteobacteria bacterium]
MTLKQRIKEKALDLGFEDIGFTGVEPLDLYIQEVESRPEMYNWVMTENFNLKRGATLSQKHPWAKSLVVLIRNYYHRRFPAQLTGKIGRCYQVDERKERGIEHQRMVDFFDFLKFHGIRFYFDEETPARMSAARAGIVTYGKNCFVYARKSMLGASWLESIPILLDAEIEPDEPSIEIGCPTWCKNACIAACPTGALYSPKKMNPFRCIAFNSYYGSGITPMDLREPMGTWVYGCDRCQEVCPRNQAWINQDLPKNQPLTDRASDFQLDVLLRMDEDHYVNKVWPLTFYISRKNIAKWQMNAARALGNLGDRFYVPVLIESLNENADETVRGMSAWALGRLGGDQAKEALEMRLPKEEGLVKEEIALALGKMP